MYFDCKLIYFLVNHSWTELQIAGSVPPCLVNHTMVSVLLPSAVRTMSLPVLRNDIEVLEDIIHFDERPKSTPLNNSCNMLNTPLSSKTIRRGSCHADILDLADDKDSEQSIIDISDGFTTPMAEFMKIPDDPLDCFNLGYADSIKSFNFQRQESLFTTTSGISLSQSMDSFIDDYNDRSMLIKMKTQSFLYNDHPRFVLNNNSLNNSFDNILSYDGSRFEDDIWQSSCVSYSKTTSVDSSLDISQSVGTKNNVEAVSTYTLPGAVSMHSSPVKTKGDYH